MGLAQNIYSAIGKTSSVLGRVAPTLAGVAQHRLNPFSIPVWLPELKDPTVLRADIIAGLTVALVLIPQSMAYAQLAGLPAYYGLYAAFMPPMIGAIFGSSRQLATGPVAMVSLMTATALEPLATSGGEAFIAYAILLSLMVGLFQLGLGLFRAGMLINFLSHPVILGFVNGAAIIIATSQLGKVFGVSSEKGEHHYEFLFNTLSEVSRNIHWPTFSMAALAFGIMFFLRQTWPKFPGVLIAVVITSFIAWAFDFQQRRSVEPKQIANSKIQKTLAGERIETKKIAVLSAKLLLKQNELEKLITGRRDSDNILRKKHLIERLQFERDQLQSSATDRKALLRSTSLYSYRRPSGNGLTRYYTRREHPSGPNGDAIAWQVSSIAPDGSLELRAGGQIVGEIPRGLPRFAVPTWNWKAFTHLIEAAIVISLVGFMEAISIARAMSTKTRQRLDIDKELIGQGLANISGSFLQSYPTSGSFSRSAVNINAGAVTGFASVVTSLVVMVTLLWLTPVLYYLPQATLAAVIMMAVLGLVNIKSFIHTWRAKRHDGIVALITFGLTLALAPELETAIIFGVLLSLLLLLYRTVKPRVVLPAHRAELLPEEAVKAGLLEDGRVVRMRFEGSLVFSSTSFFEKRLQEILSSTPQLRVLIIDGVSINEIDASGNEMLREIHQQMQETGVEIIFVRLKKPVRKVFIRSGLLETFGRNRLHRHPKDAFSHAWKIIKDDQN